MPTWALTLEELRAISADVTAKAAALREKANNLEVLMGTINRNISPNNPFINNMFPNPQNVDDFVATQTPLYIQRLTDIEVAADALGTDPYNP